MNISALVFTVYGGRLTMRTTTPIILPYLCFISIKNRKTKSINFLLLFFKTYFLTLYDRKSFVSKAIDHCLSYISTLPVVWNSSSLQLSTFPGMNLITCLQLWISWGEMMQPHMQTSEIMPTKDCSLSNVPPGLSWFCRDCKLRKQLCCNFSNYIYLKITFPKYQSRNLQHFWTMIKEIF